MLASVSLALPARGPLSVVTDVRGAAALIFAADVSLFHSAPRGRTGRVEKNILGSHKLRRCEKRAALHGIVGKAVYLDCVCGPSHTIRGSCLKPRLTDPHRDGAAV